MSEMKNRNMLVELPETSREPMDLAERPTIHFTELPEDKRGGALARDWNFYRQEVGRLVAEGNEGKWLLIKEEKIIGIWASRDEAAACALKRYLNEPVLIHQIQEYEPILHLRGCNLPWPTSSLPLAKPA